MDPENDEKPELKREKRIHDLEEESAAETNELSEIKQDGSNADSNHEDSDARIRQMKVLQKDPPLFSAAVKFYAGMAVASIIWMQFFWGKSAFLRLGLTENIRSSIELAALFTVSVVFISFLLTRFTRWGQAAETVIADALGPLKLWQVFFMAFFSGIAEELLFRGAMQLSFASVWGNGNAIFITSFIFGLFHPPIDRRLFYFPYMAMLLSLLLGWCYWYTGNILCPMMIHFGINFCNMSVMVISDSKQK